MTSDDWHSLSISRCPSQSLFLCVHICKYSLYAAEVCTYIYSHIYIFIYIYIYTYTYTYTYVDIYTYTYICCRRRRLCVCMNIWSHISLSVPLLIHLFIYHHTMTVEVTAVERGSRLKPVAAAFIVSPLTLQRIWFHIPMQVCTRVCVSLCVNPYMHWINLHTCHKYVTWYVSLALLLLTWIPSLPLHTTIFDWQCMSWRLTKRPSRRKRDSVCRRGCQHAS